MRTAKYARLPTQAELVAFTGMHCARLYQEAVRSAWQCLSCGRSARELVRWTEIRGQSWRARYGDEDGMGFTVTLARHHCHGAGRFAEALICGDCNAADGAAKRRLRLPAAWSFSPTEIGRFVKVVPHSGATRIDYDQARRIYDDAIRPT